MGYMYGPGARFPTGRAGADQAITSSTTFADATGVTIALEANKVYRFLVHVPFNLAGIISGYKFQLLGPTSPTNYIASTKLLNTVAGTLLGATVQTALGTAVNGGLATSGNHVFEVSGVIENGANAGSLKLQFAQNVSDGSAITIKRGAFIQVFEI
jgi:hypothetical protein